MPEATIEQALQAKRGAAGDGRENSRAAPAVPAQARRPSPLPAAPREDAPGLTIGAVLRHHGEVQPDRAAVVATGRAALSWHGLSVYLDAVRDALRAGGLGPEARIGVALPNGPDAALAIVAIASSAVAVPFDPALAEPEIELRLRLLRLAAVVLPGGRPGTMRTVAGRIGLPVIEADIGAADRLGANLAVPPQAQGAGPAGAPGPDTSAFILQTSGTTGLPKLIAFSHGNMLATARRVQSWFALTPEDRCLSAGPVYYCHGLTLTVLIPLLSGGSTVFPRDPSALDLDEWLCDLQPTWLSAGPTLHRYLMEKSAQRDDARALHRLRFVVSGGAPLPSQVQRGLEAALGVPVLEHYGASEAAQISANLPPPGPAKAGTCGVPDRSILVVADDDGREVPQGQAGEVLIRGPSLISGYLDAPDLDRTAFADGWFRTGDLGRLDEDGFLVLLGRKKEMINRGGEKIAPAEIDDALMRHPDVVEAAGYGVPHPRLGEDVAADVVLRPGATVSELGLRTFLCDHLAAYKIPRRLRFVERLPKGATGKVQRKNLGGGEDA